jgi:flavin-binding protein dodecin
MSRFLYNANALALGGTLTRPFKGFIASQSACVLPQTGGKASSTSPGYEVRDPETGNLILKIGSSETSVEGGDNGASARTVIDSTVRDLDVLGVFEVAEITLHVETTVPNEGRQVSMTGSAFRGVSIGGKTFDITFDDAMAAEAAADYKQFRKDHPEVLASKGEILYSLARSPELKFEPENYGYYYQPDFGRIYFAEWTAAPNRQCINMLRLQLGSPAEGRVIVLGADNNGGWMP